MKQSSFAQKRLKLTAKESERYDELAPLTMPLAECEQVLDEIIAEREIRNAPQFRHDASLRARKQATFDRLQRAAEALVADSDPETIREVAQDDPEGFIALVGHKDPEALERWKGLETETNQRTSDLSMRLTKSLGPYLDYVTSEKKAQAALGRARDEAVLDELDDDAAAGLVTRRLVEAGYAGDLLDGARTSRDEDELFRLAAAAPAEVVADPHAGMTDAQLERAMLGGEQPRDRIVAPGVSVELLQHSNDPAEQLEALRKEVEAMEKSDPRSNDDDETGFKRFFRP